ncbi:hypothetical protein [Caenimonas aquaedulcis]|uniref:Uncharacterized protein n=1 Tax=Caenimonas aquaedulcis TaxID=2793270 RepID=A0A931H8C9_9BURK|nr:hypothetical protein [Caenimonas aquaedulcis]MBG9390580.1 hypothetical protein [Caenimonas aquaedulcis]
MRSSDQHPSAGSESRPQAREKRPMTAAERTARILATRWASPYSKAGVPTPRASGRPSA